MTKAVRPELLREGVVAMRFGERGTGSPDHAGCYRAGYSGELVGEGAQVMHE